jgi:hypothetical protein
MSTETVQPRLLIPPKDAAAALSLSRRTLWALTAPRGSIPVVRIGRAVRYDLDALRVWITAQQRTPAS